MKIRRYILHEHNSKLESILEAEIDKKYGLDDYMIDNLNNSFYEIDKKLFFGVNYRLY